MEIVIRPFQNQDADDLNSLARDAFLEFSSKYTDWNFIESAVSNMSNLSQISDVFVAESSGKIVGGVALVPHGAGKKEYFNKSCASLRMLVVSPKYRGYGIGKNLTDKCVIRAKEIGASSIGLHTSPMMQVALNMYLKMGFVKIKDVEPIAGVEYSVYTMSINI